MLNITHTNEGTINKNSVSIETEKGKIVLWFSYKTIVSFNLDTYGENGIYDNGTTNEYFSRTTSKFINEIDKNKDKRLNPIEFKARLERALSLVSLTPEHLTAIEL
jgi:hypothetical protein